MGVMDKMKFWKRDEDFGDLGNLDDFSLDDKPGAAPGEGGPGMGIPPDADPGAMGALPNLEEPTAAGMEPGVPTKIEELQPSEASRQMGEQLGIGSPTAVPQPHTGMGQMPQHPPQQTGFAPHGGDITEIAKDIEIMHAKIDAIRSSLESINQRLASLERIASGPQEKRYTW